MKTLAALLLTMSALLAPAGLSATSPALTQVPAKEVCMVNDHHFGSPQIPVDVEGRTYYGCCEMCKAKLEGDASARMAVDPVTKAKVDKARAVIGAAPNGRVYYFESTENLKKFKLEQP